MRLTYLLALVSFNYPADQKTYWRGLATLFVLMLIVMSLQTFTPIALTALWLIAWLALAHPLTCLMVNRLTALNISIGWAFAIITLFYLTLIFLTGIVSPALVSSGQDGIQAVAELRRRTLFFNLVIMTALLGGMGLAFSRPFRR